MTVKHCVHISLVVSILASFCSAANAQESRSMLDGTVEAAEAGRVEMVTNSSREVVQIRVEGCETCRSQSYLPSRNLSATLAGRPVQSGRLFGLSGGAGTLIIDADSGMVERVDFWVERGEVGADQ